MVQQLILKKDSQIPDPMFVRQKIKMEDSYHELQANPPYPPNEDSSYASKYAKNPYNLKVTQPQVINPKQNIKYPSFKTDYSEDQRPNPRNEILKELRQQYEILKNLSIDESVHVAVKKEEPVYRKYEEKQSSLSSSVASKENKARQMGSYKHSNRQIQSLNLQKKQLELVIGNSMRKIQELLANEISLKKTIHQLKNQIQGRGGITMQYEKTIRGLQKNQEELQAELSRLKHQNQKHVQKIREQNEKARSFESQYQKKERQLKQAFDEQRRLQQMLRIEKDKYMNLQIQCRSYRMEFEMLQKQKNNEINRLVRQFQGKQGGNQKQLTFIIKKLQDEVREKDKRYHELLLEREKRSYRESDVIQLDKKGEKDKGYLEEIVFRSREIHQNNNKALNDGMSLIFAKMAEMERKNDQNLKKEIQLLKKKTEEAVHPKKNSENERQLTSRISQLEKIIERDTSQKEKLYLSIKELNEQKVLLEEKIREVQKKMKDHYSRKQNSLVQKFSKQFQQITVNYREVEETYNNLKAEYIVLAQKLKEHQNQGSQHKSTLQAQSAAFREKQKKYEEEIRTLKRKIDEASFEAQKNKKQGEFNLNIYKTSQQSQTKRLVSENQRITQKLKETEEKFTKLQKDFQTLTKLKENEQLQSRNMIESLKSQIHQEVLNQKKSYEDRIIQIDSKHSQELKNFNQKFIGVTATNERLMAQLSQMGKLESELFQLRRLLKSNRSTSSGIDHLWQIKETQYGNIIHVLRTLQE